MKISQTAKNNIIYCTVCILASCLITFCLVGFTGIVKGQKGDRGLAAPREVITRNYLDVLEEIWANWERTNDPRLNDYVNKYEMFIAYMRNERNDTDPDEYTNYVGAANNALRSAVDIISCGTGVKGENGNMSYLQYGGGVLYQLEKDNGFWHGYVITNYHVISKYSSNANDHRLLVADTVYLRFYASPWELVTSKKILYECVPARVIGGSDRLDVAVIEFGVNEDDVMNTLVYTDEITAYDTEQTVNEFFEKRNINKAVRPAIEGVDLSNNPLPIAGSSMLAIGNPLGQQMSVTFGMISRDYEIITLPALDQWKYSGGYDYNRVYRITANINPGNSGGGIFNIDGDFIGIVQARMYATSAGEPVDGIAYAIPLDIVARVADQIIRKHGYPNYGNWDAPLGLSSYNWGFTSGYHDGMNNVTYRVNANGTWELVVDDVVTILTSTKHTTPNPNGNGWVQALVPDATILSVTVFHENDIQKTFMIKRVFQIDDIALEAYGRSVMITIKVGDAYRDVYMSQNGTVTQVDNYS